MIYTIPIYIKLCFYENIFEKAFLFSNVKNGQWARSILSTKFTLQTREPAMRLNFGIFSSPEKEIDYGLRRNIFVTYAYLFYLPLENVMKILRTREMRLCSIKKYIFLKWYAFFELMKYNETTDKSTFYRDRWVDDLKNVILSKFGSNDEMTSHSGFGL